MIQRKTVADCAANVQTPDLMPLTLAEEELFWGDSKDSLTLREDADESDPEALLDRTSRFGMQVVRFAKRIPHSVVNAPLITQFVKSGTSVGANYCEADDPLSRKDYMKSIGICRKESKETKYWLQLIVTAEPSLKAEARVLWKEARELNLIFGAIYRSKEQ